MQYDVPMSPDSLTGFGGRALAITSRFVPKPHAPQASFGRRARERDAVRAAVLVLALLTTFAPTAGRAQIADPLPNIPVGARTVRVEPVVTLPDSGTASRPSARPMTLIGDGTGRRFVVDQNGIVYQIHVDDSLSVFLDVAAATPMITDTRQQGLSSAAFHPDYHVPGADGEGVFYTASSQTTSVAPDYPVPTGAPTSHHSVLHEWQVDPADPDAIDPLSVREVLRIGEPYGDHNIGQIAFDPNAGPGDPDRGLLYVATGDGGNFGCCPRPSVDPHFVGQDLGSPLGAILRIDPLPDGTAPYTIPTSNVFASDGDPGTLAEIYAYGFRNPHRFAWDRGGTGRLLVSDIGQSNIEEIGLVENGENHGWSEREGTFLVEHFNELDVFPLPPGDELLGFTYPVLQYDHDEGDRAISGGEVVRGGAVPPLQDHYVFGDLRSGRVFVAHIDDLDGSGQAPFETVRLLDATTGTVRSLLEIVGGGPPAPRTDLRFGRDDAGVLYLLTKPDGTIRRIAAAGACQDGIDNDGDGLVDFDGGDPGCRDADWPLEDPECQDGIDNDGQLGTDFDGGVSVLGAGGADPAGADPQCDVAWRDLERPPAPTCGLGPEIALLLAGLGLLWRRH